MVLSNDREWQKEKIKKQSESKIKLITLNQQLGFGKYSKLKVKDIISSDPQYIKWVAENTGKRFAEEVYNALKLLNNDIDPSKGENVIDYIPIRVTYASDYSDCFITERSINLLHNGYTNKIKIGNKTKTLFSSIFPIFSIVSSNSFISNFLSLRAFLPPIKLLST